MEQGGGAGDNAGGAAEDPTDTDEEVVVAPKTAMEAFGEYKWLFIGVAVHVCCIFVNLMEWLRQLRKRPGMRALCGGRRAMQLIILFIPGSCLVMRYFMKVPDDGLL